MEKRPYVEDKSYVMVREADKALAYVVENGLQRDLKHVAYHSPAGLEWGYGGSGPADLALSILTDVAGAEIGWNLHQAFKWAFISGLPYGGGVIPMDRIRLFLRNKGAEKGA